MALAFDRYALGDADALTLSVCTLPDRRLAGARPDRWTFLNQVRRRHFPRGTHCA